MFAHGVHAQSRKQWMTSRIKMSPCCCCYVGMRRRPVKRKYLDGRKQLYTQAQTETRSWKNKEGVEL